MSLGHLSIILLHRLSKSTLVFKHTCNVWQWLCNVYGLTMKVHCLSEFLIIYPTNFFSVWFDNRVRLPTVAKYFFWKDLPALLLSLSSEFSRNEQRLLISVCGDISLLVGFCQKNSCLQCGKAVKNRFVLKGHQIVHINLKPHQCEKCSKCFKNKADLIKHQARHNMDKPHACPQCEKSLSSKGKLRDHQTLHSNLRAFICDQCKTAFKRKQYLQNHQIIHLAIKPITCDQCSFTTKHQYTLKQHIKSNHEGVRYECNMCDKHFLGKKYLNEHKKFKHDEEKTLKCSFCQYKSWSSEDINAHKQRKHSTLFKCEHCDYKNIQRYK